MSELWASTPQPHHVPVPSMPVHEAAGQAVVALHAGDAGLTAGAPLDQADEAASARDLLAGGAGPALAHDGHHLDAESLEIGLDLGLAAPRDDVAMTVDDVAEAKAGIKGIPAQSVANELDPRR